VRGRLGGGVVGAGRRCGVGRRPARGRACPQRVGAKLTRRFSDPRHLRGWLTSFPSALSSSVTTPRSLGVLPPSGHVVSVHAGVFDERGQSRRLCSLGAAQVAAVLGLHRDEVTSSRVGRGCPPVRRLPWPTAAAPAALRRGAETRRGAAKPQPSRSRCPVTSICEPRPSNGSRGARSVVESAI
jgi:hypothetical protein